MNVHCLYAELAPVETLKPHPKNRNTHPKDQIARLASILAYQGIRAPIVVSSLSGFIVKGHGTLEAIRANGARTAPIVYQDFKDSDQEYAFLQGDNAIAAWAEIDLSGINTDLADLGPDFDIDMLGLRDFVVEPAEKLEPGCEPDDVPDRVDPRTKPGDLYVLGSHRLLCGDSTIITDMEKLMQGQKADLWLTDPPYGVSYHPEGTKHDKIENDDLKLEDMAVFWETVASNALMSCTDKAAYYWFACQGGDQMMMMMMSIGCANWKVRHELIWVKDTLVMSRCDYHYRHEPILYGWKRDGTHEWQSDRKQTSVLEFLRPKRSEEHPTMKPVELIAYLMGNSSTPGQIVLDTFGGSGTTLIAAEQTNRKCYMIELSPKYCDVIVARYEKYSGKQAVLANG